MSVCPPKECRRVTKSNGFNAAVMVCVLCVATAIANDSEAATIRVPADYVNVQQAISAALSGDTVIVSPGTYFETIDFLGKNITLTSEQGPDVTIIDAHGGGSVVSFKRGETRSAVLNGFTLRDGYSNVFGGGGIAIISSSPTIRGNIIRDNHVCGNGGGISSLFGSPLIEHNTITHNGLRGCTGGGLGIYIFGNSAAEIIGNLITENNDNGTGSVFGGGVLLNAAGSATVRGNVISHNVIGPAVGGCGGYGGAMWIANNLQGTIVDNLMIGNHASCGAAAVYWIGYGSTGASAFVNNTVADNQGRFGAPAVYTAGVDSRTWFANNVITTPSGPALLCNNVPSVSMPTLAANDMFRADLPASPYGGTCPDQTGLNGNISAPPLFLDPAKGDYRVRVTSPIIDAGDDAAPQLPSVDLTGNSRIVDGNGDGVDHVDMGALEYRNHTPVANAGDDRTVVAGPNCVADASLSGSGSDADGDALTYTWTTPSGASLGETLVLRSLPVGTYLFTLTVEDGSGAFASDRVVITVADGEAPTITAVLATPSIILQTNHQMVPVLVSASITDCDSAVSCRVVSVTSNEPEDGVGDGDTAPDWEVTGDLTLKIRAERAGKGAGRVYTVTVACTDASGNTSTSTVTIAVPHGV